jgi:hypothetical protein
MSLAKITRKAIFGLLAIAAISYGLRLHARQQNGQLTPPPKAASPRTSPESESASSGAPLLVGERLVYNVSWSSFPTAARVQMEVAAQGHFYGRESYQLRSRVETLGQVRSLFGDIDNQYTSYIGVNDAVPHLTVSAIHQSQAQTQAQGQGQKRAEEVVVFDHSRRKAIFSDESEVTISGETYDLTSLVYWLRLQPLADGSKFKITALYNKELIEVEAVVKGRERIVAQAGAYNAILVNFYPRGKFSRYRGCVYISADSQRLPVMVKANMPIGEARAELASVSFASPSEPSPAKLSLPPDEGILSGESGGVKAGIDAESAPKPSEYPFIVGERLSYDISWGNFSSVGKASFETRQQGIFNGNRVIEFFAEASTIGAARTLIDVNDQVSSLVLTDSLVPIRTDLRLREGRRFKLSSATYDRSKNVMSLSTGSQTNIPPGAYDILSLFYAIRAADLQIGTTREFAFFDANNRPQSLAIKVVKQESIGTPFGARETLRVDIFATKPAKKPPNQPLISQLPLAQTWISNDASRLPFYIVTRTRFGELRFQLVNAVNTK